MSLEEAVNSRRSVREFATRPLTAEQLSQLCWAGQGITEPRTGLRAAPSAGALYPIELYLVTAEGVDQYVPHRHALTRHKEGDVRSSLQAACLDQECVGQASLAVVIAAVESRTARKYGQRAERYCLIEAGHVAQNILLQAVALGLGGVPVGACDDAKVARVLDLPKDHAVLYVLAVGQPKK
jgi:SagB-type dehydrogenase family enzyme